MDPVENKIDRQLISGKLPTHKLYPAIVKDNGYIDYREKAINGLKTLKEDPQLLYWLIKYAYEMVEVIEVYQPSFCFPEINCLINARCIEDSINDVLFLNNEINQMKPVVTRLDKALCFLARCFSSLCSVYPERASFYNEMMFTWVYLLRLAQNMELKKGQTIEIKKLKQDSPILHLLLWQDESVRAKKYLHKLTNEEKAGLYQLGQKRAVLAVKVAEDKETGRKIAERTQNKWGEFLSIVNDLSNEESRTIKQIFECNSKIDKIRNIKKYDSIIESIKNGVYCLNGQSVALIPIFDATYERFKRASSYAVARTEDDDIIRINQLLLVLT